jgi:hypothetical protein
MMYTVDQERLTRLTLAAATLYANNPNMSESGAVYHVFAIETQIKERLQQEWADGKS